MLERQRYRKSHRAFSLAELMISIVVLASLSVLMVGIIPATIMGLRSASERATATLLVQAALEQTRKQDFDQLQSINFERKLNGRTYQVTTTVGNATASDGSALDSNHVKSIQITVLWAAKGGEKTENFATIIVRGPH